jgi:hypothetical protein
MRMKFVIGALALGLAGCQSAAESQISAQNTCSAAGLRQGSAAYNRCVGAAYQENRRQSDQATTAVVAGTAAGLIGGAVLGAASTRGRGYGYYRCNAWGCW